ncbi:hypothetical protein RQP46_002788 [Phenoliferia psychrophenolica]
MSDSTGDLTSWCAVERGTDHCCVIEVDNEAPQDGILEAVPQESRLLQARIEELEDKVFQMEMCLEEREASLSEVRIELSTAVNKSSELERNLDTALKRIDQKQDILDLSWRVLESKDEVVTKLEALLEGRTEALLLSQAKFKRYKEKIADKEQRYTLHMVSLMDQNAYLEERVSEMKIAAEACKEHLTEAEERMRENMPKPELATGDADAAPSEPSQGFSNKYLSAMAYQILNRTHESIIEALPLARIKDARRRFPAYDIICEARIGESSLGDELRFLLDNAIPPALKNLADVSRDTRYIYKGTFEPIVAYDVSHEHLVEYVLLRADCGCETKEATDALLKFITPEWWTGVAEG